MKIGKTQAWTIIIALALITGVGAGSGSYFLYFAPTQAQVGTTSIDGLTVVVPRFGSVNCETTGSEPETLAYLLNPQELPGTSKTSVTCSGMPVWEAEALRRDWYRYCETQCGWPYVSWCVDPCKADCDTGYADLISSRTLLTSGSFRKVPGMQRSITCTGTTCKIYAPISGGSDTEAAEAETRAYLILASIENTLRDDPTVSASVFHAELVTYGGEAEIYEAQYVGELEFGVEVTAII